MEDPGTGSLGVFPNPEVPTEILVVTPGEQDYAALRGILAYANWRLHRVLNCTQARAFLGHRPAAVLFSDTELPDGDWKDLLYEIANSPEAPSMIVFSRLADDRLWAEALNLGAYDLLETPFEPNEVRRVVHAAWRNWKNNLERAALGCGKPQSAAGSDPIEEEPLAAGEAA